MGFFARLKSIFRRRPPLRLGIALGSGGAKGMAHLGALKAFEEEGISFDVVAGTSIGAIAGALILGVSSLFSVPLFFLVAVDAMGASLELTRSGLFLIAPSGFGIYSKPYFIRSIAVFLFLVLLAIGERAVLAFGLSKLPIFL